uniref:pyruvate dehydrogenase (NADP(+)) n=1 Tax=Stygiella incarcerata TaxID=1712417 RepID=A0A192ZI22_9EUKA|nr:pyruvate ferredoxin oxidoreductase 3 [Stygiella incarcerata]ANM86874.1 pyruvate ferredoxin oxidoreductase 3 [Stygiella incarcerata]
MVSILSVLRSQRAPSLLRSSLGGASRVLSRCFSTAPDESTLFSKRATLDGNTAAAHVAYMMSDAAFIFPITPSSNMGMSVEEWSDQKRKNIFNQVLHVSELQSEGGAAGAVHGSLVSGALTTTFTSSQGLLLMIPNMYKIAGELLPCVFHVAARSVASQVLNIFGDHTDVMGVRQTGFALLASSTVQECMDFAAVAHLATLKARVPFVHFFEGFRLSHEINTIQTVEKPLMKRLVDMEAIHRFRQHALNPEHPTLTGSSFGFDALFQLTESSNTYFDNTPQIVQDTMDDFGELTGRHYKLFDFFGPEDAENVIVCMGSATEAAIAASTYLNGKGEKTGVMKVRLYRPFSRKAFLDVMPKTVRRVAVLDRTKERGSIGEPLLLDVQSTFYESNMGNSVMVVGGRYGIGQKEFNPEMAIGVYDNLKLSSPKNHFTIGINDDVTHTSLTFGKSMNESLLPRGTRQVVFWGMGSDGAVGAAKGAIKIITQNPNMHGQGYFTYSAHKSGSLTISHLRFGPKKIEAPFMVTSPDFVACHQKVYVQKYGVAMARSVKPYGTIVLNTPYKTVEALEEHLPGEMMRLISEKNIRLYNIDATGLAVESGFDKNRTNMIMLTAFFHISSLIPAQEAVDKIKKMIAKEYGHLGSDIVAKNSVLVDKVLVNLLRVNYEPSKWRKAEVLPIQRDMDVPDIVRNLVYPLMDRKGSQIPVSVFFDIADGRVPVGTTKYLKRGVADKIPIWKKEKCIQCNVCSASCPHSAIRPFLVRKGEQDKYGLPESFEMLNGKGKDLKGLLFRIQVAPLDCTGCTLCAQACPEEALVMEPLLDHSATETKNWAAALHLPSQSHMFDEPSKRFKLRFSQFHQPLLEFPGACEGCGETVYAKMLTQLFGEELFIANATGCSTVWARSPGPFVAWTTNQDGHGPAWGNSLFEDNAEYGFGMAMAVKQRRSEVHDFISHLLRVRRDRISNDMVVALESLLKVFHTNDSWKAAEAVRKMIAKERSTHIIGGTSRDILDELERRKDMFARKSMWIIGGDGWAYDIGYGGLDHVIASGEDVNVLVMDTEVYSNTGGQMSKSTNRGAIAKFASGGKMTAKKDLGLMCMSYGNVYVASVCFHADIKHTIRAFQEAESYPGSSLILAYSTCTQQHLKGGMAQGPSQMVKAVACGYVPLYRYDPRRLETNQNPLQIEYSPKVSEVENFMLMEARFSAMKRVDPPRFAEFRRLLESDCQENMTALCTWQNAIIPQT